MKSILSAECKPISAKLFSNGCKITKQVKLTLNNGINHIRIVGLPSDLVPESIRVSVNSTMQIVSVAHQLNYDELHKLSENTEELKMELETIEKELAEKNAIYDVLESETEMLLMGRNLSSSKEKFNIEEYREAVNFFSERMKRIKINQIILLDEIRALEQKKNLLHQKVGKGNMAKQPTSEVLLEVYGIQEEEVIELEYYTRLAGWIAKYDIRVENVEEFANLTMKAEIYQNTGESWDDIRVVLSSGTPSLSTVQPSLDPLYLDFEYQIENVNRMQKEYNKLMITEAIMESVDEEIESIQQNYVAEPSVNQGRISFEFELPYNISVETGETPKTFAVFNRKLEAEYKYFNISKVEKDTFLLATMKGWEQLSLVEGEVSIFLESTFVGKTFLKPSEIEKQLELSLGRDKDIIVNRIKGKDFKSKTFFGGNVKEARTFDLRVQNNKNRKVDVLVIDQVPVSTNSDIIVEIEECSGAILDKGTGRLSWLNSVEAGESQILTIKYVVSYPKEKKVIID